MKLLKGYLKRVYGLSPREYRESGTCRRTTRWSRRYMRRVAGNSRWKLASAGRPPPPRRERPPYQRAASRNWRPSQQRPDNRASTESCRCAWGRASTQSGPRRRQIIGPPTALRRRVLDERAAQEPRPTGTAGVAKTEQ